MRKIGLFDYPSIISLTSFIRGFIGGIIGGFIGAKIGGFIGGKIGGFIHGLLDSLHDEGFIYNESPYSFATLALLYIFVGLFILFLLIFAI